MIGNWGKKRDGEGWREEEEEEDEKGGGGNDGDEEVRQVVESKYRELM